MTRVGRGDIRSFDYSNIGTLLFPNQYYGLRYKSSVSFVSSLSSSLLVLYVIQSFSPSAPDIAS